MATTKAKAIEKGSEPVSEPTSEDQEAQGHGGWAHDWRNPDAKFAAGDHCPNAELRRLAPK
jgi:hypothetical protein